MITIEGMRLALIEIRLGLLRIIQNFDVKFADDKMVKMVRQPTSLAGWSDTMNVIFEPVK